MNDVFSLISVQPFRKHTDPLEQWQYIQDLLSEYLDNHPSYLKTTCMVALPEYALGNELFTSQKIDYEKIFEKIQEFVKSNGIYLVAGSAGVKDHEQWKNRAFFWDKLGKLLGTYDKQRLFNYEKKLKLTPGTSNKIFTVDSQALKVQILICSDFWYPELIRADLHQLPDVVIIPASSVVPRQELTSYGRTLWHSLAMTRARESVVPVLVSDWAVQLQEKSWTSGGSSLVNPSTRWYIILFQYFISKSHGLKEVNHLEIGIQRSIKSMIHCGSSRMKQSFT